MSGDRTLESLGRFLPLGGLPGYDNRVQSTPSGQRGNVPGCFIQSGKKVAARPHLPAGRKGEGMCGQRPSVRAVQEHRTADRQAVCLSQGFADDKPAHAVADQVERPLCSMQFLPQPGSGCFEGITPGIVVAPDPAEADGLFDTLAQPFPSRVRPPDAVKNVRCHAAMQAEWGFAKAGPLMPARLPRSGRQYPRGPGPEAKDVPRRSAAASRGSGCPSVHRDAIDRPHR